ncbi:hypothetical protein PYCC9005_004255 [Savitreella phatthalungensis]
MKGLQAFITDIRNAKARDVEELRINTELAKIRAKFLESKLSAYDRKKYVAKLLYMYVLGWDVRFGHMEAITLVSQNTKYSEKQIGYLAISLFFHEYHDLLHLVINSIRNDLLARDPRLVCLALHCIANVGGHSVGEALSADVQRLLVAPDTDNNVRKKSALTLLRLYRRQPNVLQSLSIEKIVALLDDQCVGVSISIAALLEAIVLVQPDFKSLVGSRAALRWYRVVQRVGLDQDDFYYSIPAPWLQIKLLRLLKMTVVAHDQATSQMLEKTTATSMEMLSSTDGSASNVQQSNIRNAVLFEMLETAAELNLGTSPRAVQILEKLLSSRETNLRYLAISSMWRIAAHPELRQLLKLSTTVVMSTMRDRDVSVRRQAIDLLYMLCDQENAKSVISDLLRYLRTSDHSLREEVVLKIAVLVERFTQDYEWYIDVSLQLLSRAADAAPEQVWQRVIQVVTNNDGLQEHAARAVIKALERECSENLVKVAAYILGEFGHFIADGSPDTNPQKQLALLQSKVNSVSHATRCMLLNAYFKFYNLFPEVREDIMQIFRKLSASTNCEIQQRALEYMVLAEAANDTVMQAVCEEMPPYSQKSSALLEGFLWPNRPQADRVVTQGRETTVYPPLAAKHRAAGSNDGLDLDAQLATGWEKGYKRLLLRSKGVLYRDAVLQINAMLEIEQRRVSVYLNNLTSSSLESLKVDILPTGSTLRVATEEYPQSTIASRSTATVVASLALYGPVTTPPYLNVSYLAGSLQNVVLKLPILTSKFLRPATDITDNNSFFYAWNKLASDPTKQIQQIHAVRQGGRLSQPEVLATLVANLGWTRLDAVDPNRDNVVAASVLETVLRPGQSSLALALLRVEPNFSTDQIRLTIRCDDPTIAASLMRELATSPLLDASPSSGA